MLCYRMPLYKKVKLLFQISNQNLLFPQNSYFFLNSSKYFYGLFLLDTQKYLTNNIISKSYLTDMAS